MNYIERFLQYKCSGDILNAVNPINHTCKEISESMAIIQKIKGLTLQNKMELTVLDLCAGNALTSIMSVFMLPVKNAIAIDKKPRERKGYATVNRFEYRQGDIYDFDYVDSKSGYVIIASHPCEHALKIIDLYNQSEAKALCIIPCCRTQHNYQNAQFLKDSHMSKYDIWCLYLSSLVPGSKLTKCKNILSPCNNIIYHERGVTQNQEVCN